MNILQCLKSEKRISWVSTYLTLANLHNVFHVSQLRKYIASPDHVLEADDVQVRENLTMQAGLVHILDSQVKQLSGKEIKTVKVLWDEVTQEMT